MNNLTEILSILKNPTTNKPIDIIGIISEQTGFPSSIVKKGIAQGQFRINEKPVLKTEIYVPERAVLKFQNKIIKIDSTESKFDKFIRITLQSCFRTEEIDSLSNDQKNKLSVFIIEYFARFGYNVEELTKSDFNDDILLVLEEFYKKFFLNPNERLPKKKELSDKLIQIRDSDFDDFERLVNTVTNDFYDLNAQKLFQDFSHLFNRKGFKYLIKPLIEYEVEPIRIIERLVNGYKLVSTASEVNTRIGNRSKANDEYQNIISLNLEQKEDRVSKALRLLILHFKKKSDAAIGFKDTGDVRLSLIPEARTYNLDIKPLFVTGYLRNEGSGIAKKIQITNRTTETISKQLVADILAPGDTRKIKFQVDILDGTASNVALDIKLLWENDFNEQAESIISSFEIQKQNDKLPWEDLKRANPYSLIIVDNPNKLFGRDKLIEDLRWNIEKSASINSYVIYGQKRVGKSSIIRTLDTIYKNDPRVIFVYRTMGDIKNSDANKTFQKLGESIANKLIQDFKRKYKSSSVDIFALAKPSFVGSLAPLNEIIEFINSVDEEVRIVIALDEFDELNKEFFENGEIGKTFALNIGKGLNEKPYVGFILIGSETMENKTRQGMRLNSFEIKKVDTFDKQTEFESYCKIITEPSRSCLVFEPAVLDYLFNYTNGNPYYTNILLDKIFREAYEKRISFIDFDFSTSNIKHLVTSILSRKDFEHFWSDGLAEEAVTYEKVLDRRRRILTAFSLAKRENPDVKWHDIKRKIKYPSKYSLSEIQMENTIDEFKSRGIIRQNENSTLEIAPKLFEDWLLGPGLYQVIAQLEDKDEILDKVLQEEKLVVLDEELTEILAHLEEQSSKERVKLLRQFLNQFDDNNNKRLIADFLRKFIVITNSEISDYQKKVRKEIWGNIELGLGERDVRTDAEIVCIPDSYEQNLTFAESLKTTFKFVANKSIKKISEVNQIDNKVKHLIIFEPLIDCPYYYRNEISKLIKKINPSLVANLKIHLLCFVITNEAKSEIEEYVSRVFAFDFEIHQLKSIERSDICPYLNSTESINDPTWRGLSLYHKDSDETSCLVKIGNLVPYQCFPFLWNKDSEKYSPLYSLSLPLSVYKKRISISEKLKEFNFNSENNQLEFKASLVEPATNWKEILKKCKTAKDNSVASQASIMLTEAENLWSMKQPTKEITNAVKHSIAKTLAAFANTNGGEILVGVEDDLTIQGLIYDMKVHKSEEEVRRAFDSLVENYIGIENSNFFNLTFVDLGVPVLKISVLKADKEIWMRVDSKGNKLHQTKGEFYIRGQQETRLLSPQEFYEWKTNKN